MKELKISIVIPTFNQGHFIEATLESILGQDYQNFEIIVQDGGSTDNTVEILKKYGDRIHFWVSQKDGGQSDAIATGFARASGDVLCWLNSDDVYLPGALKSVNEAFGQTNADVVYGNMGIIDANGKRIGFRYLTEFLPSSMRNAYLCGSFGIYQPASFWRKGIYELSGGVDKNFRFCMDNDLFNRFVISGAKFVFVDKALADFRVHGDSKTSNLQTIANMERGKLFTRDVIDRGVRFPSFQRFAARAYRASRLLISGRLFKVLYMRYFDELKWVP